MNPPQQYRTYLRNRYGPNICSIFRHLENKYINLQHSENSITFLHKCKNYNIIPKGLRLKAPYNNNYTKRILERASKALLRERIQYHIFNKSKLNYEINNLKRDLQQQISYFDFNHICDSVYNSYLINFNKQKQIHSSKFNNLLNEKSNQNLTNQINNNFINKTVINLSDRPLSDTEKLVLSKGLNYSLTPKTVPMLDFISAIEETTQNLPEEHQEEFKIRTKIILEKPFKIKQNLNINEHKAIKTLKTDNTIKILPADKGNATVILNFVDYDQKIMSLINDGNYSKLNKNPTDKIDRQIYNLLKKHKNQFTDIERHKLTPHHSKTPHFYGVPKIHKPNTPLRPIVSSINSPTHPLAKYLLNILNPLINNTDSYIQNSKHFLEKLSQIDINPNYTLVSFDVVSLFTNVPVDKTLIIVRNKLENDVNLGERTKLNIDTILELLTFCVKTTYFQYNNDYYQQNFGMAMGSPLSPFLSNIFMESFEESYIDNYSNRPLIWWRYIDDVFSIFQYDESSLDNFLIHINSKEPTIRFTIEKEINRELPFLDILIKKDLDSFETKIYRKPTHTNRYLNFQSNHPIMVKKGVVKSLYDRAKIICNDQNFLIEKDLIKNVLIDNNYPDTFIDKCFRDFERPNLRQNQNRFNTNLFIPYIPGLSDRIKRVGNKFNIQTIFRTENTIRSRLTKTKPFNINENSKNVIYKIPCECSKFYIGETSRPLDNRIREHKNYIKNREFHRSNICQHAFDNSHRIKWDSCSIIAKESFSKKRKIKESAYILLNRDNCVASCSVNFSTTWLGILNSEIEKGNLKLN